MFKALLLIAVVAACSSAGSLAYAQVIFEPVQYQYDSGPTFYYGGSDPRVFEYASRVAHPDGIAGPLEARYAVGNSYRGRVGQPPRVFTDRIPYFDAALFGYTPADARNDANAGVPTYFRKIDLLTSAVPAGDGKTLIVPARAPLPPTALIDIRPYRQPAGPRPAGGPSAPPTTRPGTAPANSAAPPGESPRPLLIIPKSLFQPPGLGPSVRPVVVAK